MNLGGFGWALMTIFGAIVLGVVLAYSRLRNRAEKKTGDTDAATRRVYEDEDRAHRGESDNVI